MKTRMEILTTKDVSFVYPKDKSRHQQVKFTCRRFDGTEINLWYNLVGYETDNDSRVRIDKRSGKAIISSHKTTMTIDLLNRAIYNITNTKHHQLPEEEKDLNQLTGFSFGAVIETRVDELTKKEYERVLMVGRFVS